MGLNAHRALARQLCRGAVGGVAVVGLLAGCAPREPALVNPGLSTAHRFGVASDSREQDAAPGEAPIELRDVQPIGRAFISHGHFGGRWKAAVSANAAGATVYANIVHSSRFPVGAVLVKRHTDKQSGALGPTFAMSKRDSGFFPEGGDWEYIVSDSGGRLTDRGKLALCARCHAEGNADWVFGLPTDAR